MAKAPWTARPATFGLIGVCVLAFVIVFVALLFRAPVPGQAALESLWKVEDVELLEGAGALVAARVWLDAQVWRIGSAGLLHGSWLHLILNCWGLWTVGQWTERVWGPWRQLLLFTCASIGGCLASLAWAEAALVVGASGGIFGVAGALVVVRAWGRPEQQAATELVSAKVLSFWLVLWLLVGAALPFFGVSVLAQAGHIGGLVVGCGLGLAWSRPTERRLQAALGNLAVGLGLMVTSVAAWSPQWRPNYHLFVGLDRFVAGELVEGLADFEVALEAEPDDADLRNYVAYTLAEAGVELERAEHLVLEALDLEPENADYLDTLGWIQCKLGRPLAGQESLRLAAEAAEREIPEIVQHQQECEAAGVVSGPRLESAPE